MKTFIKVTIIVIAGLLSIQNIKANSITWTGGTSTSWTDAANFSPAQVPGSTDTVNIQSGTAYDPVLQGNTEVGSFTMSSGTFDLNGYEFQVNDNGSFDGGTITNGLVLVFGEQVVFDGTLMDVEVQAYCGGIQLSGSEFNERCFFESRATSKSDGQGGNVFNAPVTIHHIGSLEHFYLAMAAGDIFNDSLTIVNGSSMNIYPSYHDSSTYKSVIILSDSSTGNIEFAGDGGKSGLVDNAYIIVNNGEFTSGSLFLDEINQTSSNSNDLVFTGTATIGIDACEFDGSLTIISPNILFKNSIFNSTIGFEKTGGINNQCGGNNMFNGTSMFTNSSSAGLRFAVTSGDTFNGNAIFNCDDGNTTVGYGDTCIFESDIEVNGESLLMKYIALTGPSDQVLSGSSDHNFAHLLLEKSTGNVILESPMVVTHRLDFQQGYILSDTINIVTFNDNAVAVNAINSSFVNGPVQKIGDDEFEFPIGKSEFYRPAEISSPDYTTDSFIAEYFDSGQHNGENKDSSIAFINDCNYWKIIRNSGVAEPNLILSWDSNYCSIIDTAHIKIVNWSDNNWNEIGHGIITGNPYIGNIATISTIDSFGYFTLAYDTSIYDEPGPEDYPRTYGFVENVGQLYNNDSSQCNEIKYYGSSGNTTVYFGDTTISYVAAYSHVDSSYSIHSPNYISIDSLFRTDLILLNPDTLLLSHFDTAGFTKNYFYGDSTYTGVNSCFDIKYSDIYQNISVSFYSDDYLRFFVDSSSFVSLINFTYSHFDSLRVDTLGNLIAYFPNFTKAYTIICLELLDNEWHKIQASFVVQNDTIKFNIEYELESSKLMITLVPLILDDVLVIQPRELLRYSSLIQDSNIGWGPGGGGLLVDITSDEFDNIYAVGYSFAANFPIAGGNAYFGFNSLTNVILIGLNELRELIFATYFGGSNEDEAYKILLDQNGDIVIAGKTSTEHTTTPYYFPIIGSTGDIQSTYGGGDYDGFIAKFDPVFGNLFWSSFLGDNQIDVVTNLALASNGNLTVVGYSGGNLSFGGSTPGYSQSHNGGLDGFITTYDASMNQIQFTYFGGSDDDYICSAIYNSDDELYIAGGTTSAAFSSPFTSSITANSSGDFPIGSSISGQYVHGNFGLNDVFVSKFSSINTFSLNWSTLHGGSGLDFVQSGVPTGINSIAFSEGTGELYFAYKTMSSDVPLCSLATADLNSGPIGASAYSDIILVRFDASLDIDWTTYYGGSNNEQDPNLAINNSGELYIGFYTGSADMNTIESVTGAYYDDELNGPTTSIGWADGFISKFSRDGINIYGTYFGGRKSNDAIIGLFVRRLYTNQESVLIVGQAGSDNFPLQNIHNPTQNTFYDDNTSLIWSTNSRVPFICNMRNVYAWSRFGVDLQDEKNLFEFDNSVYVFPNPTNHILNIYSNKLSINNIIVYSIIGGEVFKQNNVNSSKISLNLENQQNGYYIVRLKLSNGSYYSEKFVKY